MMHSTVPLTVPRLHRAAWPRISMGAVAPSGAGPGSPRPYYNAWIIFISGSTRTVKTLIRASPIVFFALAPALTTVAPHGLKHGAMIADLLGSQPAARYPAPHKRTDCG
jgi:hypothetical protein